MDILAVHSSSAYKTCYPSASVTKVPPCFHLNNQGTKGIPTAISYIQERRGFTKRQCSAPNLYLWSMLIQREPPKTFGSASQNRF